MSKKSGTFIAISIKMHFLFWKKTTVHFSYFIYIFAKTEFILKNLVIKMISEKFSTNPESFNEFERGRRIDWWFPVEWPYCRFQNIRDSSISWITFYRSKLGNCGFDRSKEDCWGYKFMSKNFEELWTIGLKSDWRFCR